MRRNASTRLILSQPGKPKPPARAERFGSMSTVCQRAAHRHHVARWIAASAAKLAVGWI